MSRSQFRIIFKNLEFVPVSVNMNRLFFWKTLLFYSIILINQGFCGRIKKEKAVILCDGKVHVSEKKQSLDLSLW
jgi:hypothetical protein